MYKQSLLTLAVAFIFIGIILIVIDYATGFSISAGNIALSTLLIVIGVIILIIWVALRIWIEVKSP